jgi:uncharacterized protein
MQTYEVKVIPNSSKNEVIVLTEHSLKVKLTTQPEKGKANKQLINLLADYFKVKPKQIEICKGETSAYKKVEINF